MNSWPREHEFHEWPRMTPIVVEDQDNSAIRAIRGLLLSWCALWPLWQPFDPSTSSGQASSGQKCTHLRARFGARPGSCAGKIKESSRRCILFSDNLLILCPLCGSVSKSTRLRAQTWYAAVRVEGASSARRVSWQPNRQRTEKPWIR